MPKFMDQPVTTKQTFSGRHRYLKRSEPSPLDGDFRYGGSAMQGWRGTMEDAHVAVTEIPSHPDYSFFAIFDGHGTKNAGDFVSKYCAASLLSTVIQTDEFKKLSTAKSGTEFKTLVTKAMKTGFQKCDDELREIMNRRKKSGSTAVCVLITREYFVFANCGDSRAVLCSDGSCSFATADHEPDAPKEKARIEAAGGMVFYNSINGELGVARALGDFQFKSSMGRGPREQMVTSEPDVTVIKRSPKDEFIVLACDGIWDVMTNDQMCEVVREWSRVMDNLVDISKELLQACLKQDSRDNMTLTLIQFKQGDRSMDAKGPR